MRDEVLHPHGPLHAFADGVHLVEGAWKRSPLRRRMTVLVLPGHRLALHSAMRLTEPVAAAVEALGRVAWIVVPNRYHCSEAWWWSRRHPEALVLAPREARERVAAAVPRLDGTIDDDWPAELGGTLDPFPLRGTRFGEVALVHRPSRTLVLTDLCFNLDRADFGGVARWMMALNGALDGFGPTRLLRHVMVSDRAAFAASLRPLLAQDVEGIVLSHGHVVPSGGAALMRAAFAREAAL